MTKPNPDDFDSTAPNERNVATAAATDREEFLSLLPHYYRGEMSQSGNLLSRLDLTTDWAIVVVTAVLALAFQSSGDVSAYLLLIGIVGVSLFLLFDVRRYRIYDASRARVRLLEENLFANALDPSDVPLEAWRAELGEDLRTPTFKVSYWEAISRRLRRIYYHLYLLLGVAWLFRITLYTPKESWSQTASVSGVPGAVVAAAVAAFFLTVTVFTLWPRQRKAKGEVHGEKPGRWKQ
ncbi:DUF2270 domain-containing protein [Haloterrigena sp. H1]|uniref:DUF2270 domain-containing protein n=1 Tax=Haloterrigena sp. H1 TaxID=2552943 RepID=UPI00110F183E|nr:DUF2270 domain-containing protein [Haloterrigena sp. H1]TMT85793.1 DUF2270 domain-containing protein [Haloterrigena sp. H1]